MSAVKTIPRVLAVAAVVLTLGCDGGTTEPPELSQVARDYLDQVVGVMEANSLRRNVIDWTAFRQSVFAAAGSAQTIQDTYPAIQRALNLLADGSSTFRTAGGMLLFPSGAPCPASPGFTPPPMPEGVGYVRVRSFTSASADPEAYVAEIRSAVTEQDDADLEGWIVDLRGNLGGDLWLMLAAIGPILGEGVVGYYVDPDGTSEAWEYRDGASWLDGVQIRHVGDLALDRANPRVAVLTDGHTLGAGEGVAVAFRGRPGTRSFGQATCGVSTRTREFTMTDGAVLSLTTSAMADRTATVYGGSLTPDQFAIGIIDPVERAIEWLLDED